jgi:hypothetical protein
MQANDEHQQFRTLQAALRARPAEDGSPLERLATGQLSDDEVAALRAEAERSEDGKLDFELYRPLDQKEKDRIHESVRARVRAAARRRWGVRALAGGTAAAALAALVPMYVRPRVEVTWAPTLGPSSEASGDGVLRFDNRGAPQRLTIVPVHGFAGTLAVRGAAFVQAGRVIPWDVPASAERNVIDIRGTKADLFPCLTGEGRILVAVGVPGPRLSPGELVGHEGRTWTGRYQVLGKTVFLGADPAAPRDGTSCPP